MWTFTVLDVSRSSRSRNITRAFQLCWYHTPDSNPAARVVQQTSLPDGGFVSPEVCEALNVTVTPGPVIMCPEGGNVTLSCRVSQRRWATSLLVVRWLFSRQEGAPEQLIVKLNMRKTQYYGNYTKRFAAPKLQLSEVDEGRAYDLLALGVTREDAGRYVCRVQEIRKHRNRWRASSNGTAATQLRGNPGNHPPTTGQPRGRPTR